MLIVSGSAEFKLESGQYNQGDRHLISIFSVNEDFEGMLPEIESFLNNLGWDDIVIDENETITDRDQVDHDVLVGAFDKAVSEKISLVVNNAPISD